MLACQSSERPDAIDPDADEAVTYRHAANGNHDAQADMAWLSLQKAIDGKLASNDAVLLALMWTNMAATSGNASHALAHAAVLLVQAGQAVEDGHTEDECQDVYAQALAIADCVADTGHARPRHKAEAPSPTLPSVNPPAAPKPAPKAVPGMRAVTPPSLAPNPAKPPSTATKRAS